MEQHFIQLEKWDIKEWTVCCEIFQEHFKVGDQCEIYHLWSGYVEQQTKQ